MVTLNNQAGVGNQHFSRPMLMAQGYCNGTDEAIERAGGEQQCIENDMRVREAIRNNAGDPLNDFTNGLQRVNNAIQSIPGRVYDPQNGSPVIRDPSTGRSGGVNYNISPPGIYWEPFNGQILP